MPISKMFVVFVAAVWTFPALIQAQTLEGEGNTTIERSRASGVIESVSEATRQIVVNLNLGGKTTYPLDESVLISDGNSTLQVTDLEPGDPVTVVQDAKGTVTEVSVQIPVQPVASHQNNL